MENPGIDKGASPEGIAGANAQASGQASTGDATESSVRIAKTTLAAASLVAKHYADKRELRMSQLEPADDA